MEISEIKELIKTLDNSNIIHLNFKDKSGSIELRKSDTNIAIGTIEKPVVEINSGGEFIKSPIVGLAYISPKPGAPAFVKVGQEVEPGQTLCLIEAMKMFNEVKADKGGIITEILFEDGSLVEFDMPLFKIEVKE